VCPDMPGVPFKCACGPAAFGLPWRCVCWEAVLYDRQRVSAGPRKEGGVWVGNERAIRRRVGAPSARTRLFAWVVCLPLANACGCVEDAPPCVLTCLACFLCVCVSPRPCVWPRGVRLAVALRVLRAAGVKSPKLRSGSTMITKRRRPLQSLQSFILQPATVREPHSFSTRQLTNNFAIHAYHCVCVALCAAAFGAAWRGGCVAAGGGTVGV
jgi:hypothetical protein